ncbi:hypothetical protein BKA64DRAFT_694054 [Cadophora sp. MPI-SDFR-AT-0126]|nr:hypothetical protein BKA64DRAFT_694054 [Leotiomycetes sp. MPI-SDFR-AT-0126]
MPSFSSRKAVRLRDASGNITHKAAKSIPAAAEQTRPQKGRNEDGSIAKKPRSAKRREEGAKARGICSGQDGFSRSTDNRSVSPVPVPSFPSTIIQKIGKGIKRSTPLLDRLFRRRSVFGVPTAEPPFSEISQVQLSMVTREVDCGKVNINTNVQGDSGGTGHKKVERNLMDATNADADSRDQNSPWGNCVTSQDIVSPEKEQTEPAVIKKGILKRSAIDSGDMFPIILSANNEVASSKLLMISDVNGSPISFTPSAPSRIPQDTKQRHSVTIGRDVSTSDLRLYRKSATTFSPQVQSYDTWPRDEYDRRGETAVCSQLTPILAQNIKEELNAFKMEMEVHKSSLKYTHFY